MEGIDGENPGKIRFPRVNLFKCESWSSAYPRCPSQQGGHPSHNPVVDSHRWICNFSLSASCSRNSSEPSMEPTWHNIPSHKAFPELSWIHLSDSKAQRCPLSPQPGCSKNTNPSQVSKVVWIPFIPACLLQFHQHTQTGEHEGL